MIYEKRHKNTSISINTKQIINLDALISWKSKHLLGTEAACRSTHIRIPIDVHFSPRHRPPERTRETVS